MDRFLYQTLDVPPSHLVDFADVKLASPLYAAKIAEFTQMYVARNTDGQWIVWNSYGDFWYSYGTTRARACATAFAAPWNAFRRPRPVAA